MNACWDEWSLQYNHWSNYGSCFFSFFSVAELTSTMVCVHRTAGLYSSLSFRSITESSRILLMSRGIWLMKHSDPLLITLHWRLFNEFFVPSNSRRPQWWCWPLCNRADGCALLDQNKTALRSSRSSCTCTGFVAAFRQMIPEKTTTTKQYNV